MRNIQFANEEIYHTYNRGTSTHRIFYDNTDRIRFLKGLMLFNSEHILPTGKALLELWKHPTKRKKPLVDIIAYVLMDNHYHLVLEQVVDHGIERFMHKLSTGYTKYRNQRSSNCGVIFQSRYKAVHIATDAQFIHITRYLHLNPYDHYNYSWRDGAIKSPHNIIKILRLYQWSSFRHYINLEINPLINAKRILTSFNGPQDYENFVIIWATRNSEVLNGLTFDNPVDKS